MQAARKAEQAATRARRRGQRSAANRSQQRRLQEESPFLDKQLTAFVVRELEVPDREKRPLHPERFMYLQCLADRAMEVGHSTWSDAFVRAVQRVQEGKAVPPPERQYVGWGVAQDEKQQTKRKRGAKHGNQRAEEDDIAPSTRRRRSQRALPIDEDAVEEDEDVVIMRPRTAGRSQRVLVEEDDDGEQPEAVPLPLDAAVDEKAEREPEDVEEEDRIIGQPQAAPREPRLVPDLGSQRPRSLKWQRSPAKDRAPHPRESPVLVDVECPELGDGVQGTPPAEDAHLIVCLTVPRRPPSPLVDFPVEPVTHRGESGLEADERHLDPLMRVLSRFVLDGDAISDVLALPPETLYGPLLPASSPAVTLTTPEPSSTRRAVVTPPPPACHAPLPSSPSALPLVHERYPTTPLRLSAAPSALAGPSPSQNSARAGSSPAMPHTLPVSPARSGVLSDVNAAQRRAIAEEKRQQWLREQSEKSLLAAPSTHQPTKLSAASPAASLSVAGKAESWHMALQKENSSQRYFASSY